MAALHRHVGGRLTVVGGVKRSFVIVGTVLGPGAISPEDQLGSGAIVTFPDLARLQEDLVAGSFLVRFHPDVDHARATARLQALFAGTVVGPFATGEISTLRRVQPLPLLLAGLVAVLAVGSLIYAVASALRRRRREVALLKALGFGRSQLRVATLFQATLLALVAVLVGLPLGLIIGRWTWVLAARTVGVVVAPVVPLVTVAGVIVLALVVALLVGAISSRSVTRLPTAAILRPE
ncbi:MAG: FtsX-like permease family protein [Acidimicrobiales bacterium]